MGFQVNGVDNAEAAPGESALTTIQLVVRRMRFKNPETGLFIAEGVPGSSHVELPPQLAAAYRHAVGPGKPIVIKGVSPSLMADDPVGTTLSCRGHWVVNDTYGLQFDVVYVQDTIPTTPDALRKYLGSGRLKGIGPVTANEMVERWGVDALRILDTEPLRLLEITGLTPSKVAAITETWKAKRAFYGLVSFLGEHGLGESKALKIQECLGEEQLEHRIRENPYVLTEVEGIGFKTADAVARSLGFEPSSPVRINAALQHILNERIQKDGHTAVPSAEWINQAASELLRPREEVQRYCQELINTGKVLLRHLTVVRKEQRNGGEEWVSGVQECVSPMRVARQENEIAKGIARLAHFFVSPGAQERETALQALESTERNLDPSQKAAAWTALTSPVSVITGGPGTGKTTTLRTIVEVLLEQGERVVLAAPTGRAAKRMAEAIGQEAKTMHRCLKYTPAKGFDHHSGKPLVGSVFVVDETSMVDTAMGAAWLNALPSGARLILVGDADQLPSVGPGDVLRSLVDSKALTDSKAVTVARLTKVHRQVEGSGIAWNARRILEGHPPSFDGDPWVHDFAFLKAEDNAGIQAHLLRLIDGYLQRGIKPQDIQVLSPQRTGEVGVDALNHLLRWSLNPEKPVPMDPEETPRFLIGERVLQTKNNYDLEVFNGDLGTVVAIRDDESMDVEMEDGRTVVYDKLAAKNLQLGYAMTVHKSQGGERPVVLMVCSASHTYMLNRNLLYTGITRGRNHVVMVGSARTAMLAARKRDELVRVTGLGCEFERVFKARPAPARRTPK